MTTSPSPGLKLAMVTLNSPNPPALAGFYARLLGWEVGSEEPDWADLRNPDGDIGMGFHIEDISVPPVWPAKPGAQQMMSHLDIRVEDLGAARAHAEACGATLAEFQSSEHLRDYLDPDGHPFCLFGDESRRGQRSRLTLSPPRSPLRAASPPA